MLVVIDTETGGLDERRHDLLSVGLVVVDQYGIKDMQEWKVKGERVTPEALNINGIDVEEHNKTALSRFEIPKLTKDFLKAHGDLETPDGKPAVTLAGWNVEFDRKFFREAWVPVDDLFDRLFSHRTLDVQAICQFYARAGVLPSLSMDDYLDLFHVKLKGKRHTAISDALATAELYLRLREMAHHHALANEL